MIRRTQQKFWTTFLWSSCLLASALPGASYTWVGTNGLTNYWTNTDNWIPTGCPNAPGDVANFNVTQSTDFYCYLDRPVTVGSMVMGHLGSAKYGQQIIGSGTLRFDNGGNPATILVCPSNGGSGSQIWVNTVLCDDLQVFSTNLVGALWIGWNMAESNVHGVRFTGNGTATLNLYGANTYTGGTSLVSGILNFNTSPVGPPDNPTNGCLGRGPVTLWGGQFRPHAGSNIVSNFNTLILAGDVTIPLQTVETNFMVYGSVILSNGTHTITQNMGMTNVYAGITFAGPIIDAPGESNSLVIAGNGITTLAATNTYAGDTVLRSGKTRLGCSDGVPVGPGKGGLLLSPGAGTHVIFDLNGYDVALNTLSNEGPGLAWIDNRSNTLSTLTFGSNNRDSTFTGTLSNSVGPLHLVQTGGGVFTLSNASVCLWNYFDQSGSPGAVANILGNTVFTVAGMSLSRSSTSNTLNIGGTAAITTGTLYLGETNGCSETVNQSGGTVKVASQMRIGHWPAEKSTYNLTGGSLTLTAPVSGQPYSTGYTEISGVLYLGIDGTGVFNQTGGSVTAGAIVLDNRGNTPGTDLYNLLSGSLTLTSPWGIRGNPSAAFTVGDGSLIPPASWTNGSPLQFAVTSNNALSGVHTNQTPVLLPNGTLVFSGTLTPGTSFTVTNGALLAGTGTMAGSLTLATGGMLAPGPPGNSPGVFSTGTLSFQPGSTYAVDLDGAGPSADLVTASNAIACGGFLVISNYGNPVTGAVFPILSAPVISGTFAGLGDGAFFIQQGRVFLCRYSPTNLTLQDEGTNSSLPLIGLQDPTPYPVTNGVLSIVGFSSNLIGANGIPGIFASVNGAAQQYVTNGSPWFYLLDSGTLPEGTNAIIFTAISSNGSSNQVFYTNVIDRTPPAAPVFSPATNRFPTTLAVQVMATDTFGVSAIHYTLDGSGPTAQSPRVTNGGSVTLTASCTLSARAADFAGNSGATTRVAYTCAPETGGNGQIRSIQPNPFRPGQGPLMVSLVCTNQETVDLVVVDMLGRTVAVLPSSPVASLQQANITWDGRLPDGRPIPRGMYLLLPRVSGILRAEQMRRLYVP